MKERILTACCGAEVVVEDCRDQLGVVSCWYCERLTEQRSYPLNYIGIGDFVRNADGVIADVRLRHWKGLSDQHPFGDRLLLCSVTGGWYFAGADGKEWERVR